MIKKVTLIFLISVLFFVGCSKSQTEEDFLNKSSEKASELASANENFALNKFINGSWEGKCTDIDKDKIVVDFENNARVKFTSYTPQIDFGSAYEQGLYEITDEKTIKLYYLGIGEVIEIVKINEDKIKLAGRGTSVIYGCNFDRIKR